MNRISPYTIWIFGCWASPSIHISRALIEKPRFRAATKRLFLRIDITKGQQTQSETEHGVRAIVNPKRNHHILPRLYLEGFVEETGEPFVWKFTKGEPFTPGNHRRNNPRRISIGKPSATRDYYAYPNASDDAEFERIENLLMSFEQKSDRILLKIRNREKITAEEKREFAFYINQMNRRVPHYRDAQGKRLPDAWAQLKKEVIEKFNLTDSEKDRTLLAVIESKITSSDYIAKVHLDTILNTKESQVTEAIASMRWHFFETTPDVGFITSDNPMFYSTGVGLLNPLSEFCFPISTTVALVGSRADKVEEGYFDANSQLVKDVNRRIAGRATKEVYFHRPEEWVQTIFDKA
jgi:hypothetical protein